MVGEIEDGEHQADRHEGIVDGLDHADIVGAVHGHDEDDDERHQRNAGQRGDPFAPEMLGAGMAGAEAASPSQWRAQAHGRHLTQ
jgi:hypothetical protein